MTPDRRVVPFKRWHYEWLDAAGGSVAAEGPSAYVMTERVLQGMEDMSSWTGVVDGSPIICAGTMLQWPGRYLAWAYVSRGTLRHMPWITTEVRKHLEGIGGRIELTVRASFKPGLRWAKQLGFEIETPCLKSFGPSGEDHVGFVRIN